MGQKTTAASNGVLRVFEPNLFSLKGQPMDYDRLQIEKGYLHAQYDATLFAHAAGFIFSWPDELLDKIEAALEAFPKAKVANEKIFKLEMWTDEGLWKAEPPKHVLLVLLTVKGEYPVLAWESETPANAAMDDFGARGSDLADIRRALRFWLSFPIMLSSFHLLFQSDWRNALIIGPDGGFLLLLIVSIVTFFMISKLKCLK